MAALDHCGHTGGADLSNCRRIGTQHGQRRLVLRIGSKGPHRGGQLGVSFKLRGLFEIGLGQRAEFGLEPIGTDLAERVRKLDNGVLGTRGRTVSARIGHFQLIINIGLLCTLPGPVERAPCSFVQRPAAAIDVDHQLRVLKPLGDDLASLHRGFFITRKLQDDCPLGLVTRPAQFDQAGCCHGRVELHVTGAAAIEDPVLNHRGKRIAGPVLGIGLNHVHMARNHQRLQAGIAARPGRDQIGGIVNRSDFDLRFAPPASHQRALDDAQCLVGFVTRAADRAQRDQPLGQIERLGLS